MNITVGKYVPRNTIIHRLDPRLKLVFNIILIILFFIVSHIFTLLLILFPVLVSFVVATRKPWHLIKLIKLPIMIFIFMMILYGFVVTKSNIDIYGKDFQLYGLTKEESLNYVSKFFVEQKIFGDVYFRIGTISLIRAIVLSLRIYAMIIATTIITYSTKPILLTKAIEDLMFPLKLIKFPVHIIAMILSIAIRFIPTLLLEANRIMKAQASRGVDFKNGHGHDKVKSLITLTIPLFVISFSRAEDLSNAMEVRGYDPYEKRTKYRRLIFQWYDYLFLLFTIGMIVVIILMEQNIISNLPMWWLLTNQKI